MATVKTKVICHVNEDGPTYETDLGSKYWYINNKLHRTDGPAIEHYDGDKEYWLNGKRYSFEEWGRLRKIICLL